MVKRIDKAYFDHYSVTGKDYDSCWEYHTNINGMIQHIYTRKLPRSVIGILGVATGQVMYRVKAALNVIPFGCELSPYAYEKIPFPYKAYVKNVHMLKYLQDSVIHDIIFSNSLGYLKNEKELQSVLRMARIKTTYFSFDPPLPSFPDEYRNISKPRRWWNDQFRKAGFKYLARSLFIGDNLWDTKKSVKR